MWKTAGWMENTPLSGALTTKEQRSGLLMGCHTLQQRQSVAHTIGGRLIQSGWIKRPVGGDDLLQQHSHHAIRVPENRGQIGIRLPSLSQFRHCHITLQGDMREHQSGEWPSIAQRKPAATTATCETQISTQQQPLQRTVLHETAARRQEFRKRKVCKRAKYKNTEEKGYP